MRPALSPGDLLVYRRVMVRPAVGDLVVFERAGSLVVHRVVTMLRDGTMRTRGDANGSLDATPLETGEVRGEVVGVLPFGRVLDRVADPGD